jgi:lysophospholipase L1-like esterase
MRGSPIQNRPVVGRPAETDGQTRWFFVRLGWKEQKVRAKTWVIVGVTMSLMGTVAGCSTQQDPADKPSAPPEATSAVFNYVALGDSSATTEGGATIAYPTYYGELAAEALGVEVAGVNEARSGTTSADLLDALERFAPLREEVSGAEIITVTTSGNDFVPADDASVEGKCASTGDLSCHLNILKGTRATLEAIVAEIRSLRGDEPTIIRFTDFYDPLPGNPAAKGLFPPAYAKNIRAFNREWSDTICGVAERNDIPCARIYKAFNGPRGAKSPFEAGFLASDGFHLSDEGHEAVAAELDKLGYAPLG